MASWKLLEPSTGELCRFARDLELEPRPAAPPAPDSDLGAGRGPAVPECRCARAVPAHQTRPRTEGSPMPQASTPRGVNQPLSCPFSSLAAVNLAKLKLFRHYYVLVSKAVPSLSKGWSPQASEGP